MIECECGCYHTGGSHQRPCTIPGGCGSVGCDGHGNIRESRSQEPCALCGRKRPIPDRVDAKCRQRVLGWIADLPSLWRRLELELVPGQRPGERVSSTSPSSRAPLTVSALSLRTASAQRLAAAASPEAAQWTPYAVRDLSIPAWVDGWARVWRARNDHHRPELVDADPVVILERRPAPPPRPVVYDEAGLLLPGAELRPVLDRWLADLAEWQGRRAGVSEEGGRIALGLGPAPALTDRPDDPHAERWAHRYGTNPQAFALGVSAGYLAAWLEHACDNATLHPDLDLFVAGLRALVNSANAALGERTDDVRLGRCPQILRVRDERGDEQEEYCETTLWQDPFASVVVCRRCRGEWPKDQLLRLAMLIREAFPEDFKRETWEAAR